MQNMVKCQIHHNNKFGLAAMHSCESNLRSVFSQASFYTDSNILNAVQHTVQTAAQFRISLQLQY